VPRITTAREPLAEDVARRTRRYLVQMSIRIVCFVGAALIDSWVRWLMVAGAVLLPYVAVVLANAGRGKGETPGTFIEPRILEQRHTHDERRP
jgi:hypothetical protein